MGVISQLAGIGMAPNELALHSPMRDDEMEVVTSSVPFWFIIGVVMGVISQLAGIGMAFLAGYEHSSYTTCWTLFITVNVVFSLLEYYLFCFVSDSVRLQVLHMHQNEDTDLLVNRWRTTFILGLAVGAVCIGAYAILCI